MVEGRNTGQCVKVGGCPLPGSLRGVCVPMESPTAPSTRLENVSPGSPAGAAARQPPNQQPVNHMEAID